MSKKKGFTLIEVLTVIALLGIIVLLAAPKFLGYTEHARLAHIKNDVKAYENEIEAQKMNGRDFTLEWSGVSKKDLEEYKDSGKLFSKRGLVSKTYSFEDNYFKIEENLIRTKLPGIFIYAEDGDVFYYGNGSGGIVYDEPSEVKCLVVEDNKESDFTWEFINDDSEVRITGYKGESLKVGIPKEIQNKLVTEIGPSAFAGAGITDVTFPKTLKKIDDLAFYDNKLSCIDLSRMKDITVMDSFGNNDIKSMNFSHSLIDLYTISSGRYYMIDFLDFSNSKGSLTYSFNSYEYNYIRFNGADLNILGSFSSGKTIQVDSKKASLIIDGNSFSGGSVGHLDFEGGNISVDGNSFSGGSIGHINFENANVSVNRNAFSGGNLSYVNFKNAELTADGNSFSGGDIGYLSFEGGDVSTNGNVFSGGDIGYFNLKNAKLISFNAINGGDIGYADFTDSMIETTSSFEGGDIYKANFHGSNIKSEDSFYFDIKILDLSHAKLFLKGYSMNSILIDELDLSNVEIVVDEEFYLNHYSIYDKIFENCNKCDFSKVKEDSEVTPSVEDWEWIRSGRTGQKDNNGEEGYFKYVGSGEEIVEIPHVIKGVPVTSYYGMFENSGKDVKKVISTNPNIINMRYMFYESKATSLDLSEFNTSRVTNMDSMFSYSKAASLNLSKFDTSNVTTMNNMFSYSHATQLILNSFNTSNVTDMSNMFYTSRAKSLDLTSFNTSNVNNMRNMFKLSKAEEIKLISFNTSNVTDMKYMFAGTDAITLDLSSFDTSNVTDMSNMFSSSSATSIVGLNKFDTRKVYDFNLMFANSNANVLDLSSFDTSYSSRYGILRHNMFANSLATKGYARNEDEAYVFNNFSHMPKGLKFEVK